MMKIHELIGATIKMRLSSINPRNEHELSEHTSGTTELDITITEVSRRGKRHFNCTLDIRTTQNSLKAKQHSKCTLDIRTTKL